MPSFFVIWKIFISVLSLTLHSVEGDWNVAPQDQTSGHLTGSSISSLDSGPSGNLVATSNPISDPIDGEITSQPFPAIEMDASCSDLNQNAPTKKRARRGNSPPASCPSLLAPQDDQKPSEKSQPNMNGGGGQVDNADPSPRPERFTYPFRWKPTIGPGKDPCSRESFTLGLIPVCDSGYIGPTTVLPECRYCVWIFLLYLIIYLPPSAFPSWLIHNFCEDQIKKIYNPVYIYILINACRQSAYVGSPSWPCAPHRENLWCCEDVRLGVRIYLQPHLPILLSWPRPNAPIHTSLRFPDIHLI